MIMLMLSNLQIFIEYRKNVLVHPQLNNKNIFDDIKHDIIGRHYRSSRYRIVAYVKDIFT